MKISKHLQLSLIDNNVSARVTIQSVKPYDWAYDYRKGKTLLARGWEFHIGKKMIFDLYDSKTGEKVQKTENVERSLRRARVAVVDLASNNEFEYFGTITINSEWHDINRPDLIREYISKLFNNYMNRRAPDFKYIFVPEYGERTHRLHFHFLISGIREDDLFINRRNKLDWHLISDNIGFCQITRIKRSRGDIDRCSKYCSKYITKQNVKIGRYRYFSSKSLKSGLREVIKNPSMCLLVRDWLEMNGFSSYSNTNYGACYSIPKSVFEDLLEYIHSFERKKATLLPMSYSDILSPWEEVQQCRIDC